MGKVDGDLDEGQAKFPVLASAGKEGKHNLMKERAKVTNAANQLIRRVKLSKACSRNKLQKMGDIFG